jgi:hypothetical protein
MSVLMSLRDAAPGVKMGWVPADAGSTVGPEPVCQSGAGP